MRRKNFHQLKPVCVCVPLLQWQTRAECFVFKGLFFFIGVVLGVFFALTGYISKENVRVYFFLP